MDNEQLIGNIASGYHSDVRSAILNLGRASAEQVSKINTLVKVLFPHSETGRGGVSSDTTDPRYTWEFDFNVEEGVNPLLEGIDGTSIYTFAGNSTEAGATKYMTLHPVFYKVDSEDSAINRPATIYETFGSLIEWFSSEISNIETTVERSSSCIVDCGYTKSIIGERAFTIGAPDTPGSMLSKISDLECYVEQLRDEVLGESYSFKSPGSSDCSGKSDCSVNEKIDALLGAVGASEYQSGYTSSGCTISIDPLVEAVNGKDGKDGRSSKYVTTLTSVGAEKYYVEGFEVYPIEKTWNYNLPLSGGSLEETTALREAYFETKFNNAFDDLFVDGRASKPFGNMISTDNLWKLGSDKTTPVPVVYQWIWNPNSAHREGTLSLPSESSTWLEDTNRAQLQIDKPFNFNVAYTLQTTSEEAVESKLGSDNGTHVYFEISLFGTIDVSKDGPFKAIAKYSGSLRDLSELPFTPTAGTGPYIRLPGGSTKLCLLKNITLNDFDWNLGEDSSDFEYDVDAGREGIESHLITHAKITLVHKVGELSKNKISEGESLYLDFVEIEWLDAPEGSEVIESKFVQANAEDSSQSSEESNITGIEEAGSSEMVDSVVETEVTDTNQTSTSKAIKSIGLGE